MSFMEVFSDFNSFDLNKTKKVLDSVSFANTERERNREINRIPILFIALNIEKLIASKQKT
jgi:hypothetical protein